MSKRRIYWALQIIGWTLLIMFEYVPYALEYGFDPKDLVGVFRLHWHHLVSSAVEWCSLGQGESDARFVQWSG